MIRKPAGIIFRFFAKAALVVFVLPLLYLVEPFHRIRLGLMFTQRIGHLAFNTDYFIRKQQYFGAPPRTTFLFFGWDPANKFLFDMFKKHLNVFESRWGTRLLSAWRPIIKRTRFWESMTCIEPLRYFIMNNTEATLSFTEEEEKRGRELLSEMGVGEDDWFVCFHARDGKYLRQWRPDQTDTWVKTDFRNSLIESYIPAAEYISSRGGFAIRMGAIVEKPLPETGNPKIIDYASKFRSDFMDIYLCAKCRFFLSSSSGIDYVSTIFDKPIAVGNFFPHTVSYNREFDLVIPRLIKSVEHDRIVSYPEATGAGFYAAASAGTDSRNYEKKKFRYQLHDADDTLDLCKDMIDRLEGNPLSEDSETFQKRYADEYLSHHAHYQLLGKVGPRFLSKYKHLIFSDNFNKEEPSSR
jgi:putative glycosyltransferase (TIGR04372 family)